MPACSQHIATSFLEIASISTNSVCMCEYVCQPSTLSSLLILTEPVKQTPETNIMDECGLSEVCRKDLSKKTSSIVANNS